MSGSKRQKNRKPRKRKQQSRKGINSLIAAAVAIPCMNPCPARFVFVTSDEGKDRVEKAKDLHEVAAFGLDVVYEIAAPGSQ